MLSPDSTRLLAGMEDTARIWRRQSLIHTDVKKAHWFLPASDDFPLQYDEAARLALTWLRRRTPAANANTDTPLQLRDHLYSVWYSASAERKLTATDGLPFVQALRVAHGGSRRWSGGWVASRVSTRGPVVATRADVHRLIAPGDYVSTASGGRLPVPGATLLVVDRLDSPEWFPSTAVLFAPTGTSSRVAPLL